MISNFTNFIVFYKLNDSTFRTFDYKNQQFKTIKKLCYDSNRGLSFSNVGSGTFWKKRSRSERERKKSFSAI